MVNERARLNDGVVAGESALTEAEKECSEIRSEIEAVTAQYNRLQDRLAKKLESMADRRRKTKTMRTKRGRADVEAGKVYDRVAENVRSVKRARKTMAQEHNGILKAALQQGMDLSDAECKFQEESAETFQTEKLARLTVDVGNLSIDA